jgi:hypothetical protein
MTPAKWEALRLFAEDWMAVHKGEAEDYDERTRASTGSRWRHLGCVQAFEDVLREMSRLSRPRRTGGKR